MSPAHHAGAEAAAAEAAALATPALADELIDTVVVTAAPADEPIATAVATAAPADEPIATAATAATSDARICDLCGEVSPSIAWHSCAADCPRKSEDYDWVTCEMCQEVSPDRGWGNCAAGCPRSTDYHHSYGPHHGKNMRRPKETSCSRMSSRIFLRRAGGHPGASRCMSRLRIRSHDPGALPFGIP